MVLNVRPKRILASFLVASAVALYARTPFAAQAPSASRPSLDYEIFKTQVEPIFAKKRWPDHARCYVCHEDCRESPALRQFESWCETAPRSKSSPRPTAARG